MNDSQDGGTVQPGLQPKRRRGPGRPFTGRDDPRRNSGGRRATPISAALARLMTDDVAERIVAGAIKQAEAGDAVARQWLADRLEGKAIARNENGDPGDFDVTLNQLKKRLKIVPSRDQTAS